MRTIIKSLSLMLFVGIVSITCSEDYVSSDFINEITKSNQNAIQDEDEYLNEIVNGKVVFEDQFNQTERIPDASKWSLCPQIETGGWCRYMSESYDQAYIKDGKLILTGEKVGETYKAGGIRTKGKVEFTYGVVEVRAKFVTAKGGWPAIWMIPNPNSKYPYEGEIDIMEQVNNEDVVYQTIHSYYTNSLKHTFPKRQTTASYNVNEFNTYAIKWIPEKIVFYVNNKATFCYSNLHLVNDGIMRQWPFNKPYYLILNYALGSSDTWPGTIDDSQLPGHMEVDWVKVTQEAE